jgi:hypothetical protein
MTFTERIVGAARLDPRVYEEVEADRGATTQALAVVVLAALAAGVGSGYRMGLGGLLGTALAAILSWLIWAWVIWLVGTRLLADTSTRADSRELMRAVGFAASPGLLRVLGILPLIGPAVFLITAIWMLVTMVVAVRQALDLRTTARAVVICLIGWVIHIVIFTLLLRILRVGTV